MLEKKQPSFHSVRQSTKFSLSKQSNYLSRYEYSNVNLVKVNRELSVSKPDQSRSIRSFNQHEPRNRRNNPQFDDVPDKAARGVGTSYSISSERNRKKLVYKYKYNISD